MNHLLYNIRKHLVEQVAFSLTIAVHTWNYVITIAMADGFGIKANLENDPNQVHLSGNEIRNALQKRFEKEYTLFHLPSLLGESLKGLLVELGYQGQKEEGQSYTNGETNDFLDCITVFFPASDSAPNDSLDQKYFVIDENSCIRDINWSFIYQAFFQKLIKEGYSKKDPQPRNLLDCAQAAEWAFVSHNDLFERANRHISLLLEKNKYSILIKQLHEIQSQFPTYYLELKKNQTLIQKIPSIITYLIQQFQQDKKLSSALIQMFQLLTVMNINSMVNYTHLLQELVTKRCYFHVDYFDSISLAVIDQPEVVPIVLEFLSKYKQILGDKTLIQLLSHTNRFGFNLLMLSLNSRKNSVFRILNFMAEHKEFIGVKTLKRVLTQKTSSNFNIIELGEHQPKIIEFLLKFISTHQNDLDNESIKEIFSNSALLVFRKMKIIGPRPIKTYFDLLVKCLFTDAYKNLNFLESSTQKQLSESMLIRLNQLNIKNKHHKELMDIIIFNNRRLLLDHFSKDFFRENTDNLRYVTVVLFEAYLKILRKEKGNQIHPNIAKFFNAGYPKKQKIIAAEALKKELDDSFNLIESSNTLKENHPELNNGRLNKLFEAFCTITENEHHSRTALTA
ncbi:hypothetical protein [Coxiella burnetii]|uniref:hypothetical protein n=1 Tax=Coxiella burnetii TaxID=777 RepID=UPI002175ED82|nr:hypothetical protein [Coxiella burnetii]